MPEIDEDLLNNYANHFLGYGALESSIWLIGPEAGGGSSYKELRRRLAEWQVLGRATTVDLQRYHARLDLPARHDWSKNIQPTWGSLIRVILATEGRSNVSTEEIRQFQISELGRSGGTNAVLDLSQISSPSMNIWNAHESGISWLKTRPIYEERVLKPRADLLRKMVESYRPKLVVFYGLTHQPWWTHIAKHPFLKSSLEKLLLAHDGVTQFAVMSHPNNKGFRGKGSRNKFFTQVGEILRSQLKL
jgi:hypothetical protein